jgi:hypothetical protein
MIPLWKNHFGCPLFANSVCIPNYLIIIIKSGQIQIGGRGIMLWFIHLVIAPYFSAVQSRMNCGP